MNLPRCIFLIALAINFAFQETWWTAGVCLWFGLEPLIDKLDGWADAVRSERP